MTSRILLRRGTAAQWVSANPVLGTGELGIETDTLKIKVGNGTSTWTQLTNYINVTPSGLSNSLGDYILLANQGAAGGPAELDANGDLLIPENSAIFWNDAAYSYTTTLTATQPTANRIITFPNATGTVALTSDITSAVNNLINAAPSALDTLNELAAAINNDSSFSTTVNNLLNGKVSKSGGDTITPATSSTAGLTFTPATGQTANLLQFIGGPVGGGVKVGPGGNVFEAPAIYANYNLQATAGGASIVPVTIKGAPSQTANLQEWQNSSGTVLAKVDANGSAQFLGLNVQGTGSGIVNIGTAAAGYVGLIVKAVVSQTANLQEWQDSSGNLLNNIQANGVLRAKRGLVAENSTSGNYTALLVISNMTNGTGLVVQGASGQTNDLQQWQNSSGTVLAKVDASGRIGVNTGVVTDYLGYTGTLSVAAASSSDVALIIQQVSGQTQNLQEWVNSSGTIMARMSYAGNFLAKQVASIAPDSSTTAIVAQGASGQTASLQEWRNSSGTMLAKVDSSGAITASNLSVGSNTVLTTQDLKNVYVTDSGTARTLGSSDAYRILEFTSSSSITVTIPNDASDTTFPIGSYVEIRQMGGGQITVSATSPATLVATDNQYKTRVQYSSIILEKRATNAWYLAGDTTA